jgi:hypothetical protein
MGRWNQISVSNLVGCQLAEPGSEVVGTKESSSQGTFKGTTVVHGTELDANIMIFFGCLFLPLKYLVDTQGAVFLTE